MRCHQLTHLRKENHEFLQPQYAIIGIDPGGRRYSMSVSSGARPTCVSANVYVFVNWGRVVVVVQALICYITQFMSEFIIFH